VAITHSYVDYGAGNDTTGDGTVGTPWKTIQKALDTITRNSTDGDQINVKAGTAQVLGATLSIATYGTPTAAAPLILRGYTSAANDGGVGEINGNATYSIWTTSNTDYVHFIDLKMGNCGANVVMSNLRNYCLLYRCEIYGNTAVNGVLLSGISRVVNCYLHDLRGNYMLYSSGVSWVLGCVLDTVAAAPAAGMLFLDSVAGVAIGNVVRIRSGNIFGIRAALMLGNTVYSATGNTNEGIGMNVNSIALSNIVEGFTGGGGDGVIVREKNAMLGRDNAAYNNTANFTFTLASIFESANNDALAASPFVDPANGDFDINGTVAGVTEDAFPLTFLGLASTAPKADKGAVQAGAGAGGVLRRVMRLMGG